MSRAEIVNRTPSLFDNIDLNYIKPMQTKKKEYLLKLKLNIWWYTGFVPRDKKN